MDEVLQVNCNVSTLVGGQITLNQQSHRDYSPQKNNGLNESRNNLVVKHPQIIKYQKQQQSTQKFTLDPSHQSQNRSVNTRFLKKSLKMPPLINNQKQSQGNNNSFNGDNGVCQSFKYSNKYQDTLQIKNMIMPSNVFNSGSTGVTGSPSHKISKQASKQSLGTIYSSGGSVLNHHQKQVPPAFNQTTSRRQSQFRSSRLVSNYQNGSNSNHSQVVTEVQQSLSTLNNGNHSLDRLPYSKNTSVKYQPVNQQENQFNNQMIENNSSNKPPQIVINSQQQVINNAHKRISLYQKRKVKIGQVSLGNISITDDRSTDTYEDTPLVQPTPYKTLSSFTRASVNSSNVYQNSLHLPNPQQTFIDSRSFQKKSKFGQTLTDHSGDFSQNLNSDRHYQQELNSHSLLLRIEEDNNEQKSRTKNYNHSGIIGKKVDSISKVSSKTELPELRQSKFQKQTTFNENSQNQLNNISVGGGIINLALNLNPPSNQQSLRLQNNQSINLNRINQNNSSFINSQTSSRTHLGQFLSSNGASEGREQVMGFQGGSTKKKQSTKLNSIRINQEQLIQGISQAYQNSTHLAQHRLNQSSSPKYKQQTNFTKHQQSSNNSYKKQSSHSVSMGGNNYSHSHTLSQQTPSSVVPGNKIRIEINKEDSVLNHLTSDHKQGVSLLYYDFNNSNQRIQQKRQRQQNVAETVIPEEMEDGLVGGPGNGLGILDDDDDNQLSIDNFDMKKKHQQLPIERLDSAKILASLCLKPSQDFAQTSPRNSDVLLVNQKIDKAKRKISRYFQQNQSLSTISLIPNQQTNNNNSNNQSLKDKKNSLKNISIDMVRLGSPFFNLTVQNQMSNSPTKSSKESSSLKFSPIKRELKSKHLFTEIGNQIVEERTNKRISEDQQFNDFSFNHSENEENQEMQSPGFGKGKEGASVQTLSFCQRRQQDEEEYSSDGFGNDQDDLLVIPEIREMMRDTKKERNKHNKNNSTVEYLQDNDSIFE